MAGHKVHTRFLTITLIGVFSLSSLAAGQTHHKVVKKPTPEVLAPVAPPVPLTPAQMPAIPPNVAFAGGQLTITAPNSTLGDILREVHKQTGASIDVPGNATERVMGTFGPGPARDILASLLNGSHFNYVLLGSATDPNSLDRVMLISKASAEPANPAVNSAQITTPSAPAAGAQAGAETMDFAGDESTDTQAEQGDIFGGGDDQSNPQQADEQGQGNAFGIPNANGVKTPEQLLQELQQRQQQGLPAAGGIPNPGNPRFQPPAVPPQPAPQ